MRGRSVRRARRRQVGVGDKIEKERKLEIQRWYKDGLRFKCRQCGKCCGGGPGFVWTSEEEIAAIAKELGMSKEEFESTFIRKVRGRGKTLKERANFDCVLLGEDGKCLVYESRPIQCRTWPFWDACVETPREWNRTAKRCPGCNAKEGKLYTQEEIDESREKF